MHVKELKYCLGTFSFRAIRMLFSRDSSYWGIAKSIDIMHHGLLGLLAANPDACPEERYIQLLRMSRVRMYQVAYLGMLPMTIHAG